MQRAGQDVLLPGLVAPFSPEEALINGPKVAPIFPLVRSIVGWRVSGTLVLCACVSFHRYRYLYLRWGCLVTTVVKSVWCLGQEDGSD